MAITQTARLERETEETRAQLEHTLDELRARVSPGQLLDQATDYLRNSSGRAFLGNLRDEVVRNPLPVALVGAGIAWIAIAGAVGRRSTGNSHPGMARDWGETAGTTDDLAHGGRAYDAGPGAMRRAHQAAEGWVDDARDAVSEAGDSVREGVDEMRERAGTMYDETVGGARRVASRAADYGRAARHAVQPGGAVMNFCREQPMLVAGLGIAAGAALAAMLPASRAESRIMGDASRDVQERVRDAAAQGLRSVAAAGEENAARGGDSESADAAADVERGVQRGSGRPNVEAEPQATPQSAAPYAEAAEAGAPGPATSLSESEYAKRD
jgi:hypothetical protein